MVSMQATAAEAATVRKATAEDVPVMAVALAHAFHEDPVFTWVLHADTRRLGMLERGFELFLRRVWMEQELTYTTDGVAGAAVWELPERWKVPIASQLRLLPAMLGVFSRRLPRVLRALTVLESGHPREPHFYLPFIGVKPDWQGHGLGGALLAPILGRCDREGVPAFLEASTPRNRAMYERHGFVVTDEFKLGSGAPPQWRMWRAAKPPSG